MRNISSPPMIEVIFELPFINEIVDFSSQSLQLSISIDLSEATTNIVVSYPEVVVNRVSSISNDVLSLEYAQLLPFLQRGLEEIFIVESLNDIVILWLILKFINQNHWEIWVLWSSCHVGFGSSTTSEGSSLGQSWWLVVSMRAVILLWTLLINRFS